MIKYHPVAQHGCAVGAFSYRVIKFQNAFPDELTLDLWILLDPFNKASV